MQQAADHEVFKYPIYKFSMKRIEAIVPADRLPDVATALEGKVGGFLAWEGKGQGSAARPTIRTGRGTGTIQAPFNRVASIVTIVDDNAVDQAINIISGAAHTGKTGDGVIFVSAVESATNIATKKQGSAAL